MDNRGKQTLGDFEIIRELGRGGMGIVYQARQRSLNRKVALKVLSSGLGMTTKAVIRFRREAEAAAKLHHTNIVPIYATGEEDGTHYYAMELVEGPSLNHVIHQMRAERDGQQDAPGNAAAIAAPGARPSMEDTATNLPGWVHQTLVLDSSTAGSTSGVSDSSTTLTDSNRYYDNIARMIAEVADALGYAHDQGVIHRDMKPSNLLLSPDGRLSINDFGLARMLEQPGMTTTGEFMGSPLYMSPEQITAGRAPLDHRTDIYSLGATLYQLLTLEPPFPGERRDQVIAQIMHKEPRPPRSVNKKIPVDLETICLKAMEKDPDRRYQIGGDMAEDLRRFVNRFAISAKRAGIVGRTTKWVRRHPAVTGLLTLVLIVGAAAGAFAYAAHQSELRMVALQRDQAKERAILAAMNGEFYVSESAIQEAEMRGASAGWVRMLRGQVALHQDHPGEAVEHLEQAVRLLPESVAARAMLALAEMLDGRWDRSIMMLAALESLTPTTPEDYLFLGWSRALGNRPGRGLVNLDEAVRMRPGSPMARVVRAQVRSWHAMDTGELADVEAALDDARTAKGMMPDTAIALIAHVQAQLVAANIHEQRNDAAAQAQALAEAGKDVEALARFAGLPGARQQRADYFGYVGREDDVLNEWRTAIQSESANDDAYRLYTHALYRSGQYEEVLATLDKWAKQGDNVSALLTRGLVLILMAPQDAPAGAMAAYRQAMAFEGSTMVILWHQMIPRLLGDEATVRAACPELRERFARLPGWVLDWYQNILEFQCGGLPTSDLIAAAGASRMRQCESYFLMGVASLAEGDRAAATDHFQSAIDTHVFLFWDWDWSQLFIDKLKQDPTWPPWIPMRESVTVPTRMSMPESEGS